MKLRSFKVSDTMTVLFSEDKKIDYIVLKIGNKTFSTNYEDIANGKMMGKLQLVETKGIGKQHQLWIKGNFTEGNNHKKLDEEKPFELNLYFHEK